MEAKHTPGPYRACRGTGKHKEAIFIKNQELDIFIGKVYGHENQPVEANAQLFTAAPELLMQLEACVGQLKTIGEADRWYFSPLMIADGEALIAKATK